MEENNHTNEAINIAALDHARVMTTYASDLRTKNFNFFLITMGVIVAAYVNIGSGNAKLAVCTVGAFVSLAFILLDIRGRDILNAAKKELVLRELELGITIQSTLQKSVMEKPIKKIISHTFVYRAIYVVGLVLSISLAVFASK